MKLKYYLRGLGVGVLLSTLILSMSYRKDSKIELSDDEIIARAEELGMTMKKSGVVIDYDAINESLNGATPELENDVEEEATIKPSDDMANSNETPEDNQTTSTNDTNKNGDSKDGDSKDETSEAGQVMDSPESEKEETTNASTEIEKSEETVSGDLQPSATAKPNSNNPKDADQDEIEAKEQAVRVFTILPGLSAKQVCYQLEEYGIISSADSFNLYMINQGLTNQIISQKVEIPLNADYETIADILTHFFKKSKSANENE